MAKKDASVNVPEGDGINWWDAINTLHKYLPEEFPKFEKIPDTDLVQLMGRRELIITTDGQGNVRFNISPGSEAETIIEFVVLSEFTRNYRGKRTDHFFYANLPFKFVIDRFMDSYAPKVTAAQMEEMLGALQVTPTSIERYLRAYRAKLKPSSDKEAFIIHFLSYARKPPHKAVFSFDEVIENCGVTEEQLEEWAAHRDVQRAGTDIYTSKREIVYRPPEDR